MRHPSFEGMRIDKKATQVLESKKSKTYPPGGKKESILHTEKIITRRKPGERKTLLQSRR